MPYHCLDDAVIATSICEDVLAKLRASNEPE
jgi:hypothetical protein